MIDLDKPLSLMSKEFQEHKFDVYRYLRENKPVHMASIMGMKIVVTAGYEDCLRVVKSDEFGRNRTTITGGGKAPFPLPKSIRALSESMILEDDPEHRRLRSLVQKAFTPKHLHAMEPGMIALCHDLLDQMPRQEPVDLLSAYATAVPVEMIRRMMGVGQEDIEELRGSIKALSEGLSGWNVVRTLLWDLRNTKKFVERLIADKRVNPGDDILSELLAAEEEGDRLSHDELVSMVFLLIIAGFETTSHLISNSVVTLQAEADQRQRLLEKPELMGSAVEELLRFTGPIHGTKMNYARQDMDIGGYPIAKGKPVMPLVMSANRDPAMFDDPETFNISRDPNRHLSFSQGNHFCLGAFLARMETRVALTVLNERAPHLQLAVPPDQLPLQKLPGWHRYTQMPVILGESPA